MDAVKRIMRQLNPQDRLKSLSSYIEGSLGHKTIYRIHDQSSWALYWVAHYLNLGLAELGVKAQSTIDFETIRKQIIHFDSRYAYLFKSPETLHPSNHAFLTWFHGNPVEDEFAPLFEKLQERQDRLRGVLVSNHGTRSHLITAGYPEDQLTLIPIGVDTQQFRPVSDKSRSDIRQELGIAAHQFCIGSFQKDGEGWGDGLTPKLIKGPDIFLEVIADLKRHHDNLVVLLTGPARGYVKAGLDKIGVPYVHRNLDDYHQVASLYHALDTYLITSRDEGGPKGFMESWASGIPVVSTEMGMPADHIQHGENGYLAPIADVAQLSQHIQTIINLDTTQKSHLTHQALAEVQALDWMAIAEQYYRRLYKPLL